DPISSAFLKDFSSRKTAIEQQEALNKVLGDTKLEMSDLGSVIASGGPKYEALVAGLEKTGDSGRTALDAIKRTRDEIQKATNEAKNSTPGFGTLSSAIKVLADESSTADDRLNAMKDTLDVIAGRPVQLDKAMQDYNRTLRETTEATKETWDQTKGFGEGLLDENGKLSTKTENGDRLQTQLDTLRDKVLKVANAGGDLGPVFADLATKYEELGTATGLGADGIKKIADAQGLVQRDIEITANLKGADETTQRLAVIQDLLKANSGVTEIPLEWTKSEEVKKALDEAGVKLDEINAKPGEVKLKAPKLDEVLTKLQNLVSLKIPDKTVNITYAEATASGEWRAPMVFPPAHRATGGPINGAGTGTSDSIPALLSHGEHVWTAREVDAVGGQGAMYNLRSRALAGGLRFAEGGAAMPAGVSDAVKAAQEAEGHKYFWSGVGLNNFDCSGFIGFLQQVAMGLGKVAKRIYTTTSLIGGATAGLVSGLGPSGTWFQVGVSEEHMAGTIAGLNVESGGQYGTSGIGAGRAGAGDSQFPYKFHLPNSLVAGIGSLTTGGTISTWTDANERELERLTIAVDEAKKRRDETYAKSDASASDKRKADLDVADAQDAVVKKQEEKDKAGQSLGGSRVAPQAPALSKKYTDNEKSYASLLQAVEQANKSRNEVYDNPASTDADKQVSDIALQEAISKLENNDSSKSSAKTVKDIFTTWASSTAGAAFDAFKTQLPDKISGSRWWDVADQAVALVNSDDTESGTSVAQALQNIGTFGANAFAGQLGYNSKREVPDWVKNLKSAAVYDTGGWLPPGGMAVNMSNTPEPIFNSPKQLQDFAGSSLQPAQGGGQGFLTEETLERYMRLRPIYNVHTGASASEVMQAIRVEQKRQSATFKRR
ncbi:hypothetical protein ACFXN1_51535, partial [Nocardia sp. NPDC059154]